MKDSRLMEVNLNSLNLIRKSVKAVESFKPKTKYDKIRKYHAIVLVQSNIERAKEGKPIDSGLYGKVKELLSHDTRSTITRVRAQGKADSFISVDGKRKPLEVKTNGGRVENLFTMSERAKATNYIRYTLDFTVKAGKPRKDGTCKPEEHRYFDGVMTVKTFIEILESTKAYKIIGHNESDKERAVQSDSKKLYKALLESGAIDYIPDFNYTIDDFV